MAKGGESHSANYATLENLDYYIYYITLMVSVIKNVHFSEYCLAELTESR